MIAESATGWAEPCVPSVVCYRKKKKNDHHCCATLFYSFVTVIIANVTLLPPAVNDGGIWTLRWKKQDLISVSWVISSKHDCLVKTPARLTTYLITSGVPERPGGGNRNSHEVCLPKIQTKNVISCEVSPGTSWAIQKGYFYQVNVLKDVLGGGEREAFHVMPGIQQLLNIILFRWIGKNFLVIWFGIKLKNCPGT